MWTLNVSLSSLKSFRLFCDISDDDVYQEIDDHKILIDAPNLEFLDVGSWSGDIMFKPFTNIIEAHININISDINKVLLLSGLLQSMVNVRHLFLSEPTLTLLWITRDPNLPTFYNLVQLELYYAPHDGPIQLMDFLYSCPKLEALSLPGGFYCENYEGTLDHEFCKNDPEQAPKCLRHSLKTVEIRKIGE